MWCNNNEKKQKTDVPDNGGTSDAFSDGMR